ncbi:MAG: DUF3572 domain-containing protein [Pseudomonadota bacterium]
MPRRPPPLDHDGALAVALGGLAFLAEDADRLGRFLVETGIGPDELRVHADDPALLASVLDHLLGDESLLLVFATQSGLAPETILPAQALLASGDRPERRRR